MFASAAIFRDFLDRLFTNTSGVINANLPSGFPRAAGFRYEQLIIVAHSLGAVVARRALLDATTQGLNWPSKIKLVLFAPGHSGANITKLALEVSSSFPFLGFFTSLARFQSPLIDQLRIGSPELQQLRDETTALRQSNANQHLKATRVIIAQYERIVTNQPFPGDPAPVAISGSDHFKVCKPNKHHLEPLKQLEAAL